MVEYIKSFFSSLGLLSDHENPTGTDRRDYRDGEHHLYNIFMSKLKEVAGDASIDEALAQNDLMPDSNLFDLLDNVGTINYENLSMVVYNSILEYKERNNLGFNLLLFDASKSFEFTVGNVGIYDGGVPVTAVFFPSLTTSFGDSDNILVMKRDDWKHFHGERLRKGGGSALSSPQKISFKEVVSDALSLNASDIHITFSGKYFYVLFRLDGMLSLRKKYIMDTQRGIEFVRHIKGEAESESRGSIDIENLNRMEDARISYDELGVDIRVSMIPEGNQSRRNSVTCRLLLRESGDTSIDLSSLGYGDDIISEAKRVHYLRGSFFIVTGVMGSGKSTFLSGALKYIPEHRRVVTIEDPIERDNSKPHITQYQVSDTLSPMEIVDGIKRGDVDVVYGGEIRSDKGYIKGIVTAARSGGLTISTAHIPSAFSYYTDFKEIFGLEYITTVSLTSFVSNHVLVRRLCSCSIEDTGGENRRILNEFFESDSLNFYNTDSVESFLDSGESTRRRNIEGCDKCRVSGDKNFYGYDGRIPIYEYFRVTSSLREWLRKQSYDTLSPFHVERMVYELKVGKNKLDTMMRLLLEGEIEVGEDLIGRVLVS